VKCRVVVGLFVALVHPISSYPRKRGNTSY